jgi:hypothetical protein
MKKMKCFENGFRWPSVGSAVVEQFTHHFKFEGSNPVKMEKLQKKCLDTLSQQGKKLSLVVLIAEASTSRPNVIKLFFVRNLRIIVIS